MPYVQRRAGEIVGTFDNAQPGYAEEWLDDDTPEIVALRLKEARDEAQAFLRAAVSRARLKYAPDASHQTTIYDVKAQEADAYIAAGRQADTSSFHLLAASAQANGRSVSDHADVVVAKRNAWIQIAAATEQLREAGENAIKAADTVEAINAARDAYVGQLAQI